MSREKRPEPIKDAMTAREAFDESRPIPYPSALEYLDEKDAAIAHYERALKEIRDFCVGRGGVTERRCQQIAERALEVGDEA